MVFARNLFFFSDAIYTPLHTYYLALEYFPYYTFTTPVPLQAITSCTV